MTAHLLDPSHPAYPPVEIIAAANLLGQWFSEHDITGWQLGPCADRNTASIDARDAARYRWLRESPHSPVAGFKLNFGLDNYTDRAMKEFP